MTVRHDSKLGEIGEHRLVEALQELTTVDWRCPSLRPGDDSSCISTRHSNLLLKIDGGSIPSNLAPWLSLYDLGWIQAVAAISDLAAKAALPLTLQVSIGLPPSLRLDQALALVRGVRDAALAHGAWLSGGDTNSSREGWVDIAAVGLLVAEKPVARSPRPGDMVYTTTGRYGLQGLLLHLLYQGRASDAEKLASHSPEAKRPLARLGFPLLAALAGECITSSMDVSDGLAFTLHALAAEAHATLQLHRLPSPSPHLPPRLSREVDVEEAILYGGQEYEIVFTVKPDCTRIVEENAPRLGLSIEKIGVIARGESQVTYKGRRLPGRGWDNFKAFTPTHYTQHARPQGEEGGQ
ncbi:MAG: hypothetical protein DSY37_05050 [Hyperthermus sp.]|nr:MAG: hypothetical protein DSY37_05050 [Hyperthermus sp.]